ncbi:PREDICTED: uncharacterized protein LOC106742739 isoform X2 [Dinoponera quadriceps]|uniref:Uncharacterized protein LOC106742739 isoform X2 n=1 Tax=Dinoponera quadriceps TaxID=609295 RepID=A0A6P3WZA3_DINQU|nr:PREDICTED: uncharacterized protein LOC106742739 isoform X2 [Dinoponera quadriceps]
MEKHVTRRPPREHRSSGEGGAEQRREGRLRRAAEKRPSAPRGMIVTSKHPVNEEHFVYVFQVEVTSKFSSPCRTAKNVTAQFAIDLICQSGTFNATRIMCHIGNYNNIETVRPMPRRLNYENKTIDFLDFSRDSPPFEIAFFREGIGGYYIEFNSIPARLMNVYRMIGNELNIGVDVKAQDNQNLFVYMERSHIGRCSTEYKIRREPTVTWQWPNLNINLTSFVDFDIEKETVVITKQRNITDCVMLENYSFSVRFWSEYVPTTTVSEGLVKSTNSLSMCSRGIKSLSKNVFNLYDEHKNVIGYVTDIINLKLRAYQELPANQVFAFDKMKTGLDRIVLLSKVD